MTFLGLVLAMVLTGCPDPAGNNGNQTPKKLTVGYLSNLMADIGDATALGISKKTVDTSRYGRAVSGSQKKNYLVKTVEDYEGNSEWDETGLTNVTFKKRTTEIVYIPIYDDDGNIIGENIIEENQTISQDEIPAQVNKLYVYNSYTFIQFVPDVTDLIPDIRPDDLGRPDRAGYYGYDKKNYYNDGYHQSFVIENSTGNIYSLADAVYIEETHNGLLKIKNSPYIWDFRIKDNDELEIFTLFQNKTIEVFDYHKDKYGNNYIYNSDIDIIDRSLNTIYFTAPDYHVASNGEVLYMKGNGAILNRRSVDFSRLRDIDIEYLNGSKGFLCNITSVFSTFEEIKLVGQNCSFRTVNDNDVLYFNGFQGLDGQDLYNDFRGIDASRRYISHLKNKKLYFYENMHNLSLQTQISVINTDTFNFDYRIFWNDSVDWSVYYNIVIFYGNDNNIYYCKIDFNSLPAEFINYGNGYIKFIIPNNHDSCTLLMENVNWIPDVGSWEIVTPNIRDKYSFVLKDINGEKIPTVVKTSEYVAEEQQVITLKPINR